MLFCKLKSGEAGYFEFGETPTVVDPRKSGRPASALTNVHEQSHRDLVNGTVYGFVLTRLKQLDDLGAGAAFEPGKRMDELLARVWNCAEGSATAAEIIAAKDKSSPAQIKAIRDALPADYKTALAAFEPIMDLGAALHPIQRLLLRSGLVHAIAETAADWPVFATTAFDDFWLLVQHLLAAPSPDSLVAGLVQAAVRTPIEEYLRGFAESFAAFHKGTPLEQFLRAACCGLKATLLRKRGRDPSQQPLLDDSRRIEAIAALDARLTAAFPQLPHVRRVAGHVFGMSAQVEIKEPEYLLPSERVSGPDMAERIRLLAQAPEFYLLVNQFIHRPAEENWGVIAMPIKQTSGQLDQATPYLICEGASADVMREVDQSDVRLVWLTYAVALDPAGYYGAEFVETLSKPVFLHLKTFSWEMAEDIARTVEGPIQRCYYELLPGVELAVAAFRGRRVTVFGLTPLGFHVESSKPNKTLHDRVADHAELACVVMVLLRSQESDTV